MPLDPISGPMPRDEFRAAIAAPHGEAKKAIRKYDPLWARQPGEKIKWKVTLERSVTEVGVAFVEALTDDEAEKLADKLKESQIEWDTEYYDGGPGDVVKIEPA